MLRYPYELPPLPYAYNALEPYIDEETMHYHHDKHFKTYIDNLNAALEPFPQLQTMPLEWLLSHPASLPPEARVAILRNGGGVYNHDLFFKRLTPNRAETMPEGELAQEINRDFGSLESFRKAFSDQAAAVFGSGYTFLIKNRMGKLSILSLPNQDTPLPQGAKTIILIDVWEHAYYLKYKNLRKDYIKNFWNIVKFRP